MKRYKIEVTARCIKKGIVDDNNYCPIGLAVHKAVGNKVFDRIEWSDRRLAKKVTKFINAFDAGGKVKPFSFVLKLFDGELE
jgi:hypothetical protein